MKQYQAQFKTKYNTWAHIPVDFGRDHTDSLQTAQKAIEYHKANNHPMWRIGNTYEYRIVEREVSEWHELS